MYGHVSAELSPQFAPPYRAYRIAQLLRARPRYDVAYFTQMQMDALSLVGARTGSRSRGADARDRPATR